MTIRVVYGPPGAGKTSYVAEHRQPGDVVIDMDALAVTLGSPDGHDHPEVFRSIAGAARASAIRRTIERGADAWVIDTSLRTESLRENAAHCEFILIDPGRTVTLQRATRAGRPQASLDAIERWYVDPPIPPVSARQADAEASDTADLGGEVADWW